MDESTRISRRDAIRWVLAAAGTATLARPGQLLADITAASPAAIGYGTDPNLVKIYKPGDLWPLTLTAPLRRTVVVLCDVIIPADERSPSASAVGVPDFIDEWISAPYPEQRHDRDVVLEGLAWLNQESKRRFGAEFAAVTDAQRTAIATDIAYEPHASAELKRPAQFFARFRNLVTGGFYTTPAGMRDIQYLGNVPTAKFAGPPPELIRQLGLEA